MCTHQSTFLVLEEQRTKGKKDYLMLYCSTSQEQGNMCYIVTVPKGRTHSTMHLFCNKWTDPLSPEQHSSKHGLRADQWSIHLSTTLLSVLQDVLFISLFVHYLTQCMLLTACSMWVRLELKVCFMAHCFIWFPMA